MTKHQNESRYGKVLDFGAGAGSCLGTSSAIVGHRRREMVKRDLHLLP